MSNFMQFHLFGGLEVKETSIAFSFQTFVTAKFSNFQKHSDIFVGFEAVSLGHKPCRGHIEGFVFRGNQTTKGSEVKNLVRSRFGETIENIQLLMKGYDFGKHSEKRRTYCQFCVFFCKDQ